MKVEIACSTWSRLCGLIGRKSFDGVLLLMPCNDVHTFGMRAPIDIAFIARDGTVVESHRGVGVCRRIRCKEAIGTLERFAEQAPWYERGDRIEMKDIIRDQRRSV